MVVEEATTIVRLVGTRPGAAVAAHLELDAVEFDPAGTHRRTRPSHLTHRGLHLSRRLIGAAIEVMARILAAELGTRGITINSVTPGMTDTDLNAGWLRGNPAAREAVAAATALGRVAEPEDVANAICLLAVAEAGWITGAVIDASGGGNL